MKKNLFLFLKSALVLFLISCSKSDGLSDGGSVEDQNAISVEQLNEWYEYGTDLHDAAYGKIDGGKLAILEDGLGARAECIADSSVLAMTMQIYDTFAVSTLQASKLGIFCNSAFIAFEKECEEKINGHIFTISNGCKDGSFDETCLIDSLKLYSANLLIANFSNIAENHCADMAKNAQTSTGNIESKSSSSIVQEDDSSSSVEITAKCDSCEVVEPATMVNYDRTLEKYILQYTASKKELSFDDRVIAYNGTLSANCGNHIFQSTGISVTDYFSESPMFLANKETLSLCFPMTGKIMNESLTNFNENCNYLIILENDGMQPTGHILNDLSEDELVFTSISSGGNCAMSNNFFSVAFLIEDCKNEFSTGKLKNTHKTFKSEIWKCEEGSYTPTPNIVTYGEWYKP